MGSPNYMDEVSEQRVIRRAFYKAPHFAIAATPTVPDFTQELKSGLLFLDVGTALRATDVYSRYALGVPVRPKNP